MKKYTLTANGRTEALPWSGGIGMWGADGVFDSGNVVLQTRVRGETTWIAVGGTTSLTKPNSEVIRTVGSGMEVSALLAGGTSPDVNIYIGGADLG